MKFVKPPSWVHVIQEPDYNAPRQVVMYIRVILWLILSLFIAIALTTYISELKQQNKIAKKYQKDVTETIKEIKENGEDSKPIDEELDEEIIKIEEYRAFFNKSITNDLELEKYAEFEKAYQISAKEIVTYFEKISLNWRTNHNSCSDIQFFVDDEYGKEIILKETGRTDKKLTKVKVFVDSNGGGWWSDDIYQKRISIPFKEHVCAFIENFIDNPTQKIENTENYSLPLKYLVIKRKRINRNDEDSKEYTNLFTINNLEYVPFTDTVIPFSERPWLRDETRFRTRSGLFDSIIDSRKSIIPINERIPDENYETNCYLTEYYETIARINSFDNNMSNDKDIRTVLCQKNMSFIDFNTKSTEKITLFYAIDIAIRFNIKNYNSSIREKVVSFINKIVFSEKFNSLLTEKEEEDRNAITDVMDNEVTELNLEDIIEYTPYDMVIMIIIFSIVFIFPFRILDIDTVVLVEKSNHHPCKPNTNYHFNGKVYNKFKSYLILIISTLVSAFNLENSKIYFTQLKTSLLKKLKKIEIEADIELQNKEKILDRQRITSSSDENTTTYSFRLKLSKSKRFYFFNRAIYIYLNHGLFDIQFRYVPSRASVKLEILHKDDFIETLKLIDESTTNTKSETPEIFYAIKSLISKSATGNFIFYQKEYFTTHYRPATDRIFAARYGLLNSNFNESIREISESDIFDLPLDRSGMGFCRDSVTAVKKIFHSNTSNELFSVVNILDFNLIENEINTLDMKISRCDGVNSAEKSRYEFERNEIINALIDWFTFGRSRCTKIFLYKDEQSYKTQSRLLIDLIEKSRLANVNLCYILLEEISKSNKFKDENIPLKELDFLLLKCRNQNICFETKRIKAIKKFKSGSTKNSRKIEIDSMILWERGKVDYYKNLYKKLKSISKPLT